LRRYVAVAKCINAKHLMKNSASIAVMVTSGRRQWTLICLFSNGVGPIGMFVGGNDLPRVTRVANVTFDYCFTNRDGVISQSSQSLDRRLGLALSRQVQIAKL